MAPRKAVARRLKRARVESTPEHRSKAREDPLASSAIPVPSPSPIASHAAEKFAGRVVAGGRNIEFSFFRRDNFRIVELIEHQGWSGFCSLNVPYYPHLIREFYSSLKRGVGSIEATVKGVKITLNDMRIGEILGIPHVGEAPDRLADRLEGLKCILEVDEVNELEEYRANQLSVEMRLLHHMTGRIFIPKTGRFDFISERELAFMTFMIRGEPLNLPVIMLHMMREAASRVKVCLPYGMALTLFFREFGVDLEDEPHKTLLPTDTYSDRSLTRMGFWKVDGIWIRRVSGQHRDQAQEEHRVVDTETEPTTPPTTSTPVPPAPAQAPQVSQAADDQFFQKLTEAVSGVISHEFSSMRDELSSLRGSVESLTGRITALEQRSAEPTVDDLPALAHEAGRLRGCIEAGLSTMQEEVQRLVDRHRDGTLLVLTDMRRIVDQIEDLTERLPPRPPPSQGSSSRQ